MPTKDYSYRLTPELLVDMREAALTNAAELIEEAEILCNSGRHARAYFLAQAGIEEVGKAVLAFQALGRNLRNGEVAQHIKMSFTDHGAKVLNAFLPLIQAERVDGEAIMEKIQLVVSLRLGREASMYVGVREVAGTVYGPSEVVSEKNGVDSVKLAQVVLSAANDALSTTEPRQTSAAEDRVFCIKRTQLEAISQDADFWRFYITEHQANADSYADAVASYHDHLQARRRAEKAGF